MRLNHFLDFNGRRRVYISRYDGEQVGVLKDVRSTRQLRETRFRIGEENLRHTIESLKYSQFLRPDNVQMHFFSSAIASFSDRVAAREGNKVAIRLPGWAPRCAPVSSASVACSAQPESLKSNKKYAADRSAHDMK